MRSLPRKIISSILILCLLVSLAGCGKKKQQEISPVSRSDRSDSLSEPEEQMFIEFAGHDYLVDQSVRKNEYDPALFVTDDGYLRYGDNSIVGVDVSSFQDEVDWNAVKASGVDFVIVRIGYRGHTEGLLHVDNRFRENMRNAWNAGMKIGVYFYGQAVTVEEAEEEAEYVLELLHPYDYKITLPVVYDWEHATWETRTVGTDKEVIMDCITTFCSRMAGAGYEPMVYISCYMAYAEFDLSRIKDYKWWLAEWFMDDERELPSFYYHYDMLQYSSRGQVPGIDAEVDMNIIMDYGEDNWK